MLRRVRMASKQSSGSSLGWTNVDLDEGIEFRLAINQANFGSLFEGVILHVSGSVSPST